MPAAVGNAFRFAFRATIMIIDIIYAGVNLLVWHLSNSRVHMIKGIIAGSRSVD